MGEYDLELHKHNGGGETTNQKILIIGFKFVIEIPKNLKGSRFKNPRVILGDENQINITKLSGDYENT